MTAPLVTTSSGAKFGKSEGNAIWLDAQLTSPYQFYQFWMHVDDRDVGRYLRYFTLLPRAEIESLDHATAEAPERRAAQQALARDVTARVHGTAALAAAEEVTEFFFGGRDPATLSAEAFELLRRESPYAEVSASEIAAVDGDGAVFSERFDVVKMLVVAGLADSNGAGRRLLQQGGVSVNRRKLGAEERTVAAAEVMLPGRHVLLGKGKREFAVVRVMGMMAGTRR